MTYVLDPGFGRGQVLGALWDHPTEKTSPLTGQSQTNTKKAFTDVNAKTGAVLSNEIVTCVALKNTTGAPLPPGTEVTLRGYKGVVDEYLAKSVVADEVFWLVIDGPTQKPVGTRVSYLVTGTSVPRLFVNVDGDEVPEDEENMPAIRVGTSTADTGTTTPDVTTPPTP
jgi:hypothetical protein